MTPFYVEQEEEESYGGSDSYDSHDSYSEYDD
jgi:hypothetical protein